jgi:hypothetical protein
MLAVTGVQPEMLLSPYGERRLIHEIGVHVLKNRTYLLVAEEN